MNVARWEWYAERHRGAIFALVGGVAAILQTWCSRGTFSPDLLPYLWGARKLLANGWNASANAYWSPLYSWLLAVPMSLHLMSSSTELLWAHIITLGVFFFAMLSWHVLLNHTLRLAAIRAAWKPAAWARIETWWYFTGCAIFLYATFEWLPNSLCTPDLLVASFILLSAALLAAILCRDRGWPSYIALGASMALGYLAKAAAFPLALLLFCMLPFLSRGEKWKWSKCLASIAAFVLIAGPFAYTVSKKEGHLTFGESGRVNFLMYVNGLPPFWFGEGLSHGGNPPIFHEVCENPQVLAFHEAPPGMYIPVYEPSRWYAGLMPHLQLRQELRNLRVGWHTLAEMLEVESDLILGFVLLLVLAGFAEGLKSVLAWWFLWFPAACGIVMFWLVHVEDRFIPPFLLLGFVGLYTGVLISNSRRPMLIVKILMAILLVQGCRATAVVLKGFFSSPGSTTSDAATIVDDLARNGVPKGAKVGVIGILPDAYWIWMAQYSFVAEVPVSGISRFLGAEPRGRQRVYSCFAKSGAQAAFFNAETPELLDPGWQKVGSKNLYVRVLGQDLLTLNDCKPSPNNGQKTQR